ncbi:MAG: tRNA lysidine(34) synthetase TilS [Planctomycetota bacterium]|nr:tRNA lysidine(34) synthetase TilS [Planctomycetota bacterium]
MPQPPESQPRTPSSTRLTGGPGRRLTARWTQLAQRLDLAHDQPLLVALSGGADSVLLTHLVASASPIADVLVVHVDHGLRGDEASADARFCESLCRSLGLPFVLRHARLDPGGSNIEARARAARYRILLDEARRGPVRAILTGHHADDALETLMLRWLRGTSLSGLSGLRERLTVFGPQIDGHHAGDPLEPVTILRPLIAMRRQEVRRVLSDRGLSWREDSSNSEARFTRNRLRSRLLPLIQEHGGEDALANLEAFSSAVESLEDRLAAATAHVVWQRPSFSPASRGAPADHLGGELARAELMRLPTTLRRRALWRLIAEGVGAPPSRGLLDLVLEDLASGRCRRHSLPGAWSLVLRSELLLLLPPTSLAGPLPEPAPSAQSLMPWAEAEPAHLHLQRGGIVRLPDGRRVSAELLPPGATSAIPRGAAQVALDADRVAGPLIVRWPGHGDRFHALGAPGKRPLRRFLADAGVPREERQRVPLVVAGGEIVWAVGLRPSDPQRVTEATRQRLVLTVHSELPASGEPPGEDALLPEVG